MIIVTDTGPLWSFAVVGRLDLLGRRLEGRVEWCSAVADEVRRNIADEPALAEVFTQDWLPVPIDLFDLGSSYVTEAFRIRSSLAAPEDHPRAHLGEAESIVLARSLKGGVLLTEDSAAARRGRFEGLVVKRTTDMLGEIVAMDDATEDEVWHVYMDLAAAGRLPGGLSKQELFR